MRPKSLHPWEKVFFAHFLGASLILSGCETPTSRSKTLSPQQAETQQHLEQLLDEGESLLKNEEYEKAISSYKEVLEKNPNNIQALNNSGYALKSQGQFQDALKYFDQALALDPKRSSTLNNKAQVLYELGKTEESQQYFDRAIENADDYVLRAEIMRNKKRALDKINVE